VLLDDTALRHLPDFLLREPFISDRISCQPNWFPDGTKAMASFSIYTRKTGFPGNITRGAQIFIPFLEFPENKHWNPCIKDVLNEELGEQHVSIPRS
jgi:hypothetical protein